MSALSYPLGLFGPTYAFDFTNTARLIRLATPDKDGNIRRRRFEMRVTQTMRAIQGARADLVVTAPSPQQVVNTAVSARLDGRYVKTSERWVVDVFNIETSYLSIIRGDSTNGVMELSLLDSLDNSDIPVWLTA